VSTHPDAEEVSADEELRRLEPVVAELVDTGARVSVDTWRPDVMRRAIELGVEFVNDVTALASEGAVAAVRDSSCRLILMHSRSRRARADRARAVVPDVIEHIAGFFIERIARLAEAGIERDRIVLDPGMGFFLSSDPGPSLTVLKNLPRLAELGHPVLVSTSRKSFIGAVLDRPVGERGPGTLATELHAWRAGVDYIRTHDVRALADAMAMLGAIERA
jgi:dihydropteroate synthase type 2